MTTTTQDETLIAVLLNRLPEGSGHSAPPEWIKLLPVPVMTPEDGRGPWHVDDAAALASQSMAAGRDLVVDFDHQTDLASKSGGRAPAAGWITRLQARADGVFGRVEWTEEGAEALKKRSYRYISPVIRTDAETGRVTRILRAGLVNEPALTQLPALAHKETDMSGRPASPDKSKTAAAPSLDRKTALERLAAKLGDAADAPALLAALGSADQPAADTNAPDAAASGANATGADAPDTNAPGADAPGADAPGADAPDPSAFVPRKAFDDVVNRLAAVEKDKADRLASELVAAAMKDGKVSPAMKDWALSYAASNPEGFRAYLKDAPQIVTPMGAETRLAAAQLGDGKTLTPSEQEICSALGLSVEDFLATRKGQDHGARS